MSYTIKGFGSDESVYKRMWQEKRMSEKMTNNESKVQELRNRYFALAHAMQSGAAMKLNYDPADTSPKHLRVGVNSAMVETGALAKLLMEKGVFTEEEYYQTLCELMENEVNLYKQWLSDYLGANIELG